MREQISLVLSYEPEGAVFARRYAAHWDGRTRFLSKKNFFPTGLVDSVVRYLKLKDLPYVLENHRKRPEPTLNLKLTLPWEPRDYQITAAEISDRRARGVYWMGTGAGKTATAAMIVEETGSNFNHRSRFGIKSSDVQ